MLLPIIMLMRYYTLFPQHGSGKFYTSKHGTLPIVSRLGFLFVPREYKDDGISRCGNTKSANMSQGLTARIVHTHTTTARTFCQLLGRYKSDDVDMSRVCLENKALPLTRSNSRIWCGSSQHVIWKLLSRVVIEGNFSNSAVRVSLMFGMGKSKYLGKWVNANMGKYGYMQIFGMGKCSRPFV